MHFCLWRYFWTWVSGFKKYLPSWTHYLNTSKIFRLAFKISLKNRLVCDYEIFPHIISHQTSTTEQKKTKKKTNKSLPEEFFNWSRFACIVSMSKNSPINFPRNVCNIVKYVLISDKYSLSEYQKKTYFCQNPLLNRITHKRFSFLNFSA